MIFKRFILLFIFVYLLAIVEYLPWRKLHAEAQYITQIKSELLGLRELKMSMPRFPSLLNARQWENG